MEDDAFEDRLVSGKMEIETGRFKMVLETTGFVHRLGWEARDRKK